MATEIGLVGFPRVQEQIANRVLTEFPGAKVQKFGAENETGLQSCGLVFFFWPETRTDTHERVQRLTALVGSEIPIVLVTSAPGLQQVQASGMSASFREILILPLRPQQLLAQVGSLLSKSALESEQDHSLAASVSTFATATSNAVRENTELEVEFQVDDPQFDLTATGDVSALLGMVGSIQGFVSLTMSDDLARTVVAKMLMGEAEALTDDDIREGLGELMNVMRASVLADPVNRNKVKLSRPTVVIGPAHSVGQSRGLPIAKAAMSIAGQPCTLLVSLAAGKT